MNFTVIPKKDRRVFSVTLGHIRLLIISFFKSNLTLAIIVRKLEDSELENNWKFTWWLLGSCEEGNLVDPYGEFKSKKDYDEPLTDLKEEE